MDDLKLCGLISSRICHDLISPIGAIGNGMELLQLSNGRGDEEIELIRDCADTAAAALKFMRIAFGARDPKETMSTRDLEAIMRDHVGRKRLTMAPLAAAGEEIAFGVAKPLMLMAIAAAAAAPRGGELTLRTCAAAPFEVSWRLDAAWLVVSERTQSVIDGACAHEDLTPGEAHLMLLHLIAKREGARLIWRSDDYGAEIALR